MLTRNLMVALALCVMVCMTTARPSLNKSLAKMGQASGEVMAVVQELQEKMLAEEGMQNCIM